MNDYSLTCTCGYVSKTMAAGDDEAVEKLVTLGKEHMAAEPRHAHDPLMSDEDMASMVRGAMVKEEMPI